MCKDSCPASWTEIQPVTVHQASTHSVRLRWKSFSDSTSGIVSCEFALLAINAAAPPSSWNGPFACTGSGEYVLQGLSLDDTVKYFAYMRVTDGAGTKSAHVVAGYDTLSQQLIPDTTAPTGGIVLDTGNSKAANAADTTYHAHTIPSAPLDVCCRFHGFAESGNGVLRAEVPYEWALQRVHPPTGAVEWVGAGTSTVWAADSSTAFASVPDHQEAACRSAPAVDGVDDLLHPHYVYKCMVRATNMAGLTSAPVPSNGFTYDATPPSGGWVKDGRLTTADAAYLLDTAIRVNWGGFAEEHTVAGAISYKVGVGACDQDIFSVAVSGGGAPLTPVPFSYQLVADACQLLPTPTVTTPASCAAHHHEAAHNTEVCFVVEATNQHGLTTRRRSDGVTICHANGPAGVSGTVTAGSVHDRDPSTVAQAVDISETNVGTYHAVWQGFATSCAPIVHYIATLQVFDSVGASWSDVAAVSQVTTPTASATFALPAAGRYRARVCVYDLLGESACETSNGFVYDVTPPEGTLSLCLHAPHATLLCAPATSGPQWVSVPAGADSDGLFLRWHGCRDPESRIRGFELDFGGSTASGGDLATLGLTTEYALPPAVTASGSVTTITVSCFNRAGSSVSTVLGPLEFDFTPPVINPSAEGRALVGAVGVLRLHASTDGGDIAAVDFAASPSIGLRIDTTRFLDAESGVQEVRVIVHPVGDDTPEGEALSLVVMDPSGALGADADGIVQTAFTASVPGRQHAARVVVTNGAGLITTWRLPTPLAYDDTKPVLAPADASAVLFICNGDAHPINFVVGSSAAALHLCFTRSTAGLFRGPSGAAPTLSISVVPLQTPPSTPELLLTEGANASFYTLDGLRDATLACDTRVRVVVRGVSLVSLVSDDTLTAEVGVICSPPAAGNVSLLGVNAYPGAGAALELGGGRSQASAACLARDEWPFLRARWEGFDGGPNAPPNAATTFSVTVTGGSGIGTIRNATTLAVASPDDPGINPTAARHLHERWVDLPSLTGLDPTSLPDRIAIVVKGCNAADLCAEARTDILLMGAPTPNRVQWTPRAQIVGGSYFTSQVDLAANFSAFGVGLSSDRGGGGEGRGGDGITPSSLLTYEVCVGTSPTGCQLLNFSSLGVIGTSWSTTQLPLLQCGATYHVAVRATNCAGLPQVGTSLPSEAITFCCSGPAGGWSEVRNPMTGRVVTSVSPSGVGDLTVRWGGFTERCSGVREYAVRLSDSRGTVVWASPPLLADAITTSIDIRAAELHIVLVHGETYVASVSATSRAGLETTVNSSTTFTVDSTPPVAGVVDVWWPDRAASAPYAHLSADPAVVCVPPSVEKLTLSWPEAADDESGITGFSLGTRVAADGPCAAFGAPLRHTELYGGADLSSASAVPSEDGCCAACASDEACTGFVIFGAACYLKSGTLRPGRLAGRTSFVPLKIKQWESRGLARTVEVPLSGQGLSFAVRACNGVGLCNASSWRTAKRVQASPTDGKVWVHPSARASGGFLSMTATGTLPPPSPAPPPAAVNARIIVGSGLNASLSGTWSGLESGSAHSLVSYDACVGTSPYGCQLAAFSPLGIDALRKNWSSNSPAGVAYMPLPALCGATYYLTLRATNCAGKQRVVASSEGATLCCSPPTGGVVQVVPGSEAMRSRVNGRQMVTTTEDAGAGLDKGLTATWSGFTERCSGVREYAVTLKGGGSGNVIWSAPSSGTLPSSQSNMALPVQLLAHGQTYTVEVMATSHAGLATTRSTTFTVDSTPPVAGVVDVWWPDRAASAPYAHLSADPAVVCVPPSVEKLTLSWPEAADDESGITGFSLGTRVAADGPCAAFGAPLRHTELYGGADLSSASAVPSEDGCCAACASDEACTGFVIFGAACYLKSGTLRPGRLAGRTSVLKGTGSGEWKPTGLVRSVQVPIAMGDSVSRTSFAVRACNGVGLCNASSFVAVQPHRPFPTGGRAWLLPSEGASSRFLSSVGAESLRGAWDSLGAPGSGSAVSSIEYRVCVGTSPHGCQVLATAPDGFTLSGVDARNHTWAADAPGLPALPRLCGATYYLTVRATNCAGMHQEMTSPGSTLCCTPPSGGRIYLEDENEGGTIFPGFNHSMRAYWRGFAEACSGVREFSLSLTLDVDSQGNSSSGSELWRRDGLGGSVSSASLPASLDSQLVHAGLYTFHVSATSHAGLVGTANQSFVIDRTPPSVGLLRDGADTPTDLACLPVDAKPGCTWVGVADPESGIRYLEWAIGSAPHGFDVQSFTMVDLVSTVENGRRTAVTTFAEMAASAGLGAGATVYCTLRVTNGAGAVTIASSDGAQLVDVPCDAGPIMCAVHAESLHTCSEAEPDNCGCGGSGPSGCDRTCGSTKAADCLGVCGGAAVDNGCGCDVQCPESAS